LIEPPDRGFAAAPAEPDHAIAPSTAPTVNTSTARHPKMRIRFLRMISPRHVAARRYTNRLGHLTN
jgi:hypothetical protein